MRCFWAPERPVAANPSGIGQAAFLQVLHGTGLHRAVQVAPGHAAMFRAGGRVLVQLCLAHHGRDVLAVDRIGVHVVRAAFGGRYIARAGACGSSAGGEGQQACANEGSGDAHAGSFALSGRVIYNRRIQRTLRRGPGLHRYGRRRVSSAAPSGTGLHMPSGGRRRACRHTALDSPRLGDPDACWHRWSHLPCGW